MFLTLTALYKSTHSLTYLLRFTTYFTILTTEDTMNNAGTLRTTEGDEGYSNGKVLGMLVLHAS